MLKLIKSFTIKKNNKMETTIESKLDALQTTTMSNIFGDTTTVQSITSIHKINGLDDTFVVICHCGNTTNYGWSTHPVSKLYLIEVLDNQKFNKVLITESTRIYLLSAKYERNVIYLKMHTVRRGYRNLSEETYFSVWCQYDSQNPYFTSVLGRLKNEFVTEEPKHLDPPF